MVLGVGTLGPPTASAAVFNVDRFDDPSPVAMACTGAASNCSLRGAIAKANGNGLTDTINVPAGIYTLDFATFDELTISSDLTIQGAGAGTCDGSDTCIQASSSAPGDIGAADNGVFDVTAGMVTIHGATIRHGVGRFPMGFSLAGGVTVEAGATLDLRDSTVTTNSNSGVAVAQGGTLNLRDSTITLNHGEFGAGVTNSGTATIRHTQVIENPPMADLPNGLPLCGGGLANAGSLTLIDSLVGGNAAAFGGGICNLSVPGNGDAALMLTNTEVIENLAVFGGGIYNDVGNLFFSFTSNALSAPGIAPPFGAATVTTSGHTVIGGNLAFYDGGGAVNTRFPFFDSTADPIPGDATATFTDSLIVENAAACSGGGVFNDGLIIPVLVEENLLGTLVESIIFGGPHGCGFPVGADSTSAADGIPTFDHPPMLTTTRSDVVVNAAIFGAGVSNIAGEATLSDSTINENGFTPPCLSLGSNVCAQSLPIIIMVPPEFGGGIYNTAGNLTLDRSTVDSNIVEFAGGGIVNDAGFLLSEVFFPIPPDFLPPATLTLTNSTISRNQAGEAAGLFNLGGATTATNITFSANVARHNAGGIENDALGEVVLNNVTITNNTAGASMSSGNGGGIFEQSANFTIFAKNSIIAGNIDAVGDDGNTPDCANPNGTVTSLGYNLIGDATGCSGTFTSTGDQAGDSTTPIDPRLATLAANGGPTKTHRLLTDSPASSAVDGVGTDACTDKDGAAISTDQRGYARPQRTSCDIGAYEVGCGDGVVDDGEQCDDGNTTDGDCCSSTCQAEVPGSPYDTDGDGVCDGFESPSGTDDDPMTASYQPPGGPLLVQLKLVSGCDRILNFHFLHESDLPVQDPVLQFPFGLVSFKLCSDSNPRDNDPCDGTCTQATVKITFPNANLTQPGFVYRKFDPTTNMYFNPHGVTLNGNMATFTLTDGGVNDTDHKINGMITDPSGPGTAGTGPRRDTAPVLSPLGLGLAAFALLSLAVFQLRRRRIDE
jgi:cysteine-rich repeat protein